MNNMDKEFIKANFPVSINHPAQGMGSLKVEEYDGKCIRYCKI